MRRGVLLLFSLIFLSAHPTVAENIVVDHWPVVYRSAFENWVFAENPSRVIGVKVTIAENISIKAGDVISFSGEITIENGGKFVASPVDLQVFTGNVSLQSFSVSGRTLCWATQGRGLSLTGLLVRITGRIGESMVDETGNPFVMLEDGWGNRNPDGTLGIRVYYHIDSPLSYSIITGVADVKSVSGGTIPVIWQTE